MNLSEQYFNEMLPVKAIPLTQEQVCIIDPEDWPLVSTYTWYAVKGRYTFYAGTHVYHRDRHRTTLEMHRLLSGYPRTDHKNGDGLDNRQTNLRSATRGQNGANSHRQSNNSSGHVGIRSRYNSWEMSIAKDGDQRYLYFPTYEQAVTERHRLAKILFGEFAPHCCDQWEEANDYSEESNDDSQA